MKQLKQKDIKKLKYQLYKNQNSICPILKQKIDIKSCCVDHQHRTSKEKIGFNGAGLIRGCIHLQANSFEGKVSNAFKRYGLDKFGLSLPDVLRNLAEYLEQDNLPLIHPSERLKDPILSKRCFNLLNKKFLLKYPKKKPLIYPKSKKLTKPLQKLFNEFNIKIIYNK
jgi:hypothetical protein